MNFLCSWRLFHQQLMWQMMPLFCMHTYRQLLVCDRTNKVTERRVRPSLSLPTSTVIVAWLGKSEILMSVYSFFHQSLFPNGFILLLAAEFKNLLYPTEYKTTPFSSFSFQGNICREYVQLCACLQGETLPKFQMIN
jgi:hypothetical protein